MGNETDSRKDIWDAVSDGDIQQVRSLLSTDPSLANAKSKFDLTISHMDYCETPLHRAVSRKNSEVVEVDPIIRTG